jgi:predicted ATPase
MTELGVHAGARTREVGRFGHVLGIHDEALDRDLDLTQVGVGVSQVLPVVVQTLLTPTGGLLLLEQPELHLHPAVQSRLVSFLLACASEGRQIICETHSEYLVSALRILIGERRERIPAAKVYFASRDGANSHLEEVRIDSEGRIRNWPRGFFDQSTYDAARLIDLDLRSN